MNPNTSALTQALAAIQQGSQSAQNPAGATFASSMQAAQPGQGANNLTTSSDMSQSPLTQAIGGQGMGQSLGQPQQGGQGQPGQLSSGQNPFFDPNAIGNLIKANLQPTGYQGMGQVNTQDLQKEFQTFLGQLHNHFVTQIRNYNPFGAQQQPQAQYAGPKGPGAPGQPVGNNPQQQPARYIPPTGQPFGPGNMQPQQ